LQPAHEPTEGAATRASEGEAQRDSPVVRSSTTEDAGDLRLGHDIERSVEEMDQDQLAEVPRVALRGEEHPGLGDVEDGRAQHRVALEGDRLAAKGSDAPNGPSLVDGSDRGVARDATVSAATGAGRVLGGGRARGSPLLG
jgi:hypothetical protein